MLEAFYHQCWPSHIEFSNGPTSTLFFLSFRDNGFNSVLLSKRITGIINRPFTGLGEKTSGYTSQKLKKCDSND